MSATPDDLIKLKLPLVQKDYELCYADTARLSDRIKQLHTLEVSVVAGLIALALRDQSSVLRALLGGLLFLAGCAAVDLGIRLRLGLIGSEAIALEQKLQVRDPDRFRLNIVEWEFLFTRLAKRRDENLPRRIYWTVRKPDFWAWHLSLAACLVVVFRT